MSDERRLPPGLKYVDLPPRSEAVRCPACGAEPPHLPGSPDCLRRQLAQAQAEVERLRREGVGGVTHFALYEPDLNVWECQADDCQFLWEFEDGNPYEHGMRFCPRCGRRIVREAQQKHS